MLISSVELFFWSHQVITEKFTVNCLTGRFLVVHFQSMNYPHPCVCEVSGLLLSSHKEATERKITLFQLDAFKTLLSVFIKNAK